MLESWCATAEGKEVSGLGTCVYKEGYFYVDHVWLLDVGSVGFTEIDPALIMKIHQSEVNPSEIKLWWHRHPVGNGKPGPHNWSGTDEATCINEPLGSSPQVVGWSVAIVRTPFGWVGRVDHHLKKKTVHLEVVQPLGPEDHAKIIGYVTRIVPPKLPAPTKKEKIALLDEACQFLGIRRGKRATKAWTERRLKTYGLTLDTYASIKTDLQSIPPEVVSKGYGIDLMALRELGLITWSEMEDAMIRAADKNWERDDGLHEAE